MTLGRSDVLGGLLGGIFGAILVFLFDAGVTDWRYWLTLLVFVLNRATA